ncbi:hypothetical protein [Streptomyces sp. NPDC056323]|uniref:hypothetical protein n=1 Tax=Streptomyces sp. NPDC056323 TaxID=3345784 RepID=UPI0035DBD301
MRGTTVAGRQALTRDPRSGLAERCRTPYRWRRESDIAATAAQMIAAGKNIGWFQGGSELPRGPWFARPHPYARRISSDRQRHRKKN